LIALAGPTINSVEPLQNQGGLPYRYLMLVEAADSMYLTTFGALIPPVVTTDSIAFSHDNKFTPIGSIEFLGGDTVTEWGFVYNTTGYPTTSGSKSSQTGTGSVGSFSWEVGGLVEGEHYYVRAFAINSIGTSYGEQLLAFAGPNYTNTILNLTFAPGSITATTIHDQSGCDNDVIYSWVANPGSITLVYSPIDTDGWSYSGTDPALNLIQDDPETTDPYDLPTERTFTGLPGMRLVNTMLDNANIPQAIFWLPWLAFMMIGFGFACFKLGNNDVLPMAIACGLVIFTGVTFQWFPWWYIPCYLLVAYACVIGQRSTGGTHL